MKFYFAYEHENKQFLVLETFSANLRDFHFKGFEHKDFVNQITNGLQFLRESKIAHMGLTEKSIAVVEVKKNEKFKFKIMNLDLTAASNEENLKRDLKSLGNLMKFIDEKLTVTHNNQMYADLTEKLLDPEKFPNCSSIFDVKQHPYFLSTKEILCFILECYKKIETNNILARRFNDSTFENNKIRDWRKRMSTPVDKKVLKSIEKAKDEPKTEQERKEQLKFIYENSNFSDWVRRIRNLVSAANHFLPKENPFLFYFL